MSESANSHERRYRVNSVWVCASVIFHEASQLAHTFVGYNNLFGSHYTKDYFPEDRLSADTI